MLLARVLSAHVLLQASAHHASPEASSVLDRYVQATHAAGSSQQLAVLTIDFSVTDAGSTTNYATAYRGRGGRLRTVVDDHDNPREWGSGDGVVWTFSKRNGVHLLTGKAAERILAETRGFSGGSLAAFVVGWGGSLQADDWRDAFLSAKTTAEPTVHNARCYEVLLTRRDGSTLRRWYEAKSGLLARETAAEFDQEAVTFRIVWREEVNGSSCYVIEMGSKEDGTSAEAYFDTKTGYLARIVTRAQEGAPTGNVTLGDYRTEDGFTMAHHIETTMAGKAVIVDIADVHLNSSIPESVFNLPEDVTALLQQHQQGQAQPADPDSFARPALRRRSAQ
jgi:hypothetical protein